jgi:shikimate kinase
MKTIFLTGPKHSGKTSAGKVLASLCSRDFIDLDDLVKSRTGKSPRALYIEGSGIFQKAEAEALGSLFETENPEPRVIAAGGGLADNPGALALLGENKAVLLVYLDISANTAWERIVKNSGGELPPFLQTANPRETHRALHERRAAAYRRLAGLVIEAEGKKPEEIAAEILNGLSGGAIA